MWSINIKFVVTGVQEGESHNYVQLSSVASEKVPQDYGSKTIVTKIMWLLVALNRAPHDCAPKTG